MTLTEEVMSTIALQLDIPVDAIELHHDLFANLGCDSLDMIEMAMTFEDQFEITVPDNEFIELRTVEQIVVCIQQILGGR